MFDFAGSPPMKSQSSSVFISTGFSTVSDEQEYKHIPANNNMQRCFRNFFV
jgi:hypothetical protein